MKTACIYHDNCDDGFAAATIFHMWARANRIEIDFFPSTYEEPTNIQGYARVFIVDFSLPREALEEMWRSGVDLLVLDHHKTAHDALKGLPYARFDMNSSGAMLAWIWCFPDRPVPYFVKLIQDRDLWRFKCDDTKAFTAGLRSHPKDFRMWTTFIERWDDLKALIREGDSILRYQKQLVQATAKKVRRATIGGHDIPVVNSTVLVSDLGHALADGEPFVAIYLDNATGRVVELRSAKGGMDVSKIAQRYGGGGHKHAAGFWMPVGSMDDALAQLEREHASDHPVNK